MRSRELLLPASTSPGVSEPEGARGLYHRCGTLATAEDTGSTPSRDDQTCGCSRCAEAPWDGSVRGCGLPAGPARRPHPGQFRSTEPRPACPDRGATACSFQRTASRPFEVSETSSWAWGTGCVDGAPGEVTASSLDEVPDTSLRAASQRNQGRKFAPGWGDASLPVRSMHRPAGGVRGIDPPRRLTWAASGGPRSCTRRRPASPGR